MSRVLVTGATGFVGSALLPMLRRRGWTVRAAVRRNDAALPEDVERVAVGDIDARTEWRAALDGVDAVVHLAARVHVMKDRVADPLAAFRRTNHDGTRGLAEACARAGVPRLVFLSSIKAQGEGSGGRPLTDADPSEPDSPYGLSKLEAEQALTAVARVSDLRIAILRPPLVYGPGVKGNFLSLLKLVDRGIPLPLGAIDNRRSLIHVGNLADAITALLAHPAPSPRPYLIHDGEAVSTPDLIRGIAAGLERPARLVPVPAALLGGIARMLGKGAAWRRLAGSLAVDDGRLRSDLGWRPPVGTLDGLVETTQWFRNRNDT